MGSMPPRVYIVEKSEFPNSVVETVTAVPAFIGYTQKAVNGNKSLLNVPWRITSMAEYHTYFGGAPKPSFKITEDTNKTNINAIVAGEKSYTISREDKYTFYYNMMLFFANGGGPCYVISVGNYSNDIDKANLESGIEPLLKEQEPTMVIIPEAVCLKNADDCYALQQAVLRHCGYAMKNRFAVLDIYNGDKHRGGSEDPVAKFRDNIGSEFLDYGAAYYPWINTSIVQETEISFTNLDIETLKPILTNDIAACWSGDKKTAAEAHVKMLEAGLPDIDAITLHKVLLQLSPFYREAMKEMHSQLNLLPVSAAMAGVYTTVDNTRGVWKAPANTSIASAINPTVNITHEEQEDLNVPMSGKAVNAIRTFVGEGIKVWGARTLDGNSRYWRYINVRRTMIMIEESIKNATRAYEFDPNVSNTWVSVKGMINNFLNGIWKRGGLVGATPNDAYSVRVGLGETMTPKDILEGIMRITVLVAMVRPAEFIEITFQQQMQKS